MGKVKKIMFVLLVTVGIFFTSGCDESNLKNDFKVDEISEENSKNVETNILDEFNSEDYISKYIEYMEIVTTIISTSTHNLTVISNAIADDPTIVHSKDFETNLSLILETFEIGYANVEDITPPEIYKKHYELILGALKEYSESVKLYKEGFMSMNDDIINKSLEKFSYATVLENQAKREMSSGNN